MRNGVTISVDYVLYQISCGRRFGLFGVLARVQPPQAQVQRESKTKSVNTLTAQAEQLTADIAKLQQEAADLDVSPTASGKQVIVLGAAGNGRHDSEKINRKHS